MKEKISIAGINDILQLLQLINSAYRGEEAKKGWTHEADLIDGTIRTDAISLEQLIQKPNAVILKYELDGKLAGCVFLEKKAERLYLGMLSVSPQIQAQGIGKKLLKAAEEHAKEVGCAVIEMTVISVRKELIAWYQRNGYTDTGKREPFPDDGKFGNPREQLEFIYMEKQVDS
ncbi:MAG TPA: GNAT family N-acetyltransferase [Flavisolibacter sp.]|nr:GNAT family N-acetyltransferase [Flavisolibacter sp.]